MGPDHPQKEIYEESKHGIAFHANLTSMAIDKANWVAGKDYSDAPTCATCHLGAAPGIDSSHDVGLRISWNNRAAVSIRPEVADARMGLPGGQLPWKKRRDSMGKVCAACHGKSWVENWYTQYDAMIELYNEKFAKPGLALYEASAPLRSPVVFSEKADWTWFELWHHEGRRARHGASMMGPDYAHWHGTYELAKHFYGKFLPELRDLVHSARQSGQDAKTAPAEKLEALIEESLKSEHHQWYLGTKEKK
jgi:hypothetical protein